MPKIGEKIAESRMVGIQRQHGQLSDPLLVRKAVAGLVRTLSCALLIAAVAACSGHNSHEEAEEPAMPPAASAPAGVVVVPVDAQRMLHLRVQTLSAVSLPAEMSGFGRVLDPQPLARAVSDWESARALSLASREELERVKRLRRQNTASIRALQAAQASATRDRLREESDFDRLELGWGLALARRTDLGTLVRALTVQTRILIDVTLPAGRGAGVQPRGARITSLVDPGRSMESDFLGPAPAVDPRLQARGFLFLSRDNPLGLTPGAAVSVSLLLPGPAEQGVSLPDSAVLREDGRVWVYVQRDSTRFVRVPVSLGPAIPGGWLVTSGLNDHSRVVVLGAQDLLSQELKPQTELPD